LFTAAAMTPATAHALLINLTYDPTVTSLSYASSVESATNYAAQQIESLFSNNITLSFNVVASSNTFGNSATAYNYSASYATVSPTSAVTRLDRRL
jgi:hypothetical protein